MRISLDYYRILTIPIKASKKQIDRAYKDRIQQKPRREYSRIAIEARKSLLRQAYDVLSDESKRAEYDGKFLTKSKQTPSSLAKANRDQSSQGTEATALESSPICPTIEIPLKLVVGALIILYELAEYEQVIRLGNYYLNNSGYINENEVEAGEDSSHHASSISDLPSTVQWQSNLHSASQDHNLTSYDINPREDIILAITLSYLELGREKWRIQEYETAAYSAQMGLNLLKQEQIFYMLQEELETDLYKLRPYRILDLLANSPANSPQRVKGLKLLKEMLQQRQGIEGKGEDYSGLKFDKFLGFIQQVRNYLTTTEQIELFVAEANRPSFVATYLAMYALLAQGYAKKQPELIVKAQEMLKSLSERQEEVHWEQAVCALLLGQAKKAHNAIEQSQEKATVELIRQYSQSSPDLLPGLCFYGEKWLLQEVLSQFRDLTPCQVTLEDYFADKKVQSYLEKLSPAHTKPQNAPHVKVKEKVSNSKKTAFANWFPWNKTARKPAVQYAHVQDTTSNIQPNPHLKSRSSTATLEPTTNPVQSHRTSSKSQASIGQKTQVTLPKTQIRRQPLTPPSSFRGDKKLIRREKRVKRRKKTSSNLIKGSLLSLGLMLGLGALGFFFTNNILQRASKSAQNSAPPEEQPNLSIEEPLVSLSPGETESGASEKPKILDATIAKNIVETWLSSKSAAFGNQHNIDQLNKILAPSLLSLWRARALQYKRNNIYRQYQHTVKIRSVNFTEDKPNQATIEAEVKETAKHYQQGKLNSAQSYDDNLLVRYQLIRQGESWLIKKSQVVKTL